MSFILLAAAFIMAIAALVKISTLNAKVARLNQQVASLVANVSQMQEAQNLAESRVKETALTPAKGTKRSKSEVIAPTAAKIAAVAALAETISEPATNKPATAAKAKQNKDHLGSAQLQAVVQESPVSEMPEPPRPATSAPKRDMEQKIASQWLVWVGGLAIAIGGLLFVKYAYDNGLISPMMQIIFGLVLAGALIFAGDRLRRASIVPVDGNDVPAALSAAGLVTAFGSIFAAYALYELIQPTTAFVGLSLVGLGALALSLRQGPLIAALGLLGSYGTPTIIPSESPSAWTFFPYLLIIMAACFAVLRKRPWHWLGYAAIAGSAAWAFLWMAGPFKLADTLPLGLFSLTFGAISMLGLSLRETLSEASGSFQQPEKMSSTLLIGATGMGVAALVLTTLVVNSAHSTTSLLLFFTGIAAIAAFSWFKRGNSLAAIAAALLSFLVLMNWRQASFIEWAMDENGLWSTILLGEAPQFMRWMLAIGSAFTLLGLAGYLLRKASINWAAIAAASAFLFLVGTWARVDEMLRPGTWALLAILAACALLGAVWPRRQHLLPANDNLAAGILTIGSALLLLFAADRLFDSIWLTLAIAVLAIVYSGLTRVMAVHLLGPIAAAFGTLTTLRLFASRQFWLDDASLPLGLHWPLYGYGIPVVLFLIASRLLKAAGHLKSAVSLEAISLGLVISLASLELRVLISGGITSTEPQLLEMATHILTWLGAAYGLLYRQQLYSGVVAKWGARILLSVSCLAIVVGPLLLLNPVWTNDIVRGGVILNALMLAYLAPVILIGLAARKLSEPSEKMLLPALGALCLVLVMTYLTLETKRLFQGPFMVARSLSNGENYAYSAVWLAAALVLFLVGIRLSQKHVRYAGLGVIILVVLKVFLLDMSGLEGLLRIASFIGLGLSLVGIGWLYQRFVQKPAVS
jgi:uncharacterized membrane protein